MDPVRQRKHLYPATDCRMRGAGRPAPRMFGADGGHMQITRWNPFTELDEIQQRLNRLFLDRTAHTGATAFVDFMPRVDIEETEVAFLVKADLPDVKKEEIKI